MLAAAVSGGKRDSHADVFVNAEKGTEREEILALLLRAYQWLMESARYKGNWDSVRSTALVAMALYHKESSNSLWLEVVREWLLNKQQPVEISICPFCETRIREKVSQCPNEKCLRSIDFASWSDELWDTAMSLLALRTLGVSATESRLRRALDWMYSIYNKNERCNWHDEPWETSWCILALLRFDTDERSLRTILEASTWLKSLQDEQGCIVSLHYTAYFLMVNQALQKLDIPEVSKKEFDSCADLATKYLMSSFDKAILWTGEAWSNGQILWALNETKRFPVQDHDIVKTVVGWFGRKMEEKGNWADVEDTAAAIMGLYHLLQRLEAVEPSRSFASDVTIFQALLKYRPPDVRVKRPLLERQPDQYTVVHISPRMRRAGYILVGLVTALGLLLGFWDFFANMLGG